MGFTGWLCRALVHVRVCVPPLQPQCSCFAGRACTSCPSAEEETTYPLLSSEGTSKAMFLEHFHLPVVNTPWGLILGIL